MHLKIKWQDFLSLAVLIFYLKLKITTTRFCPNHLKKIKFKNYFYSFSLSKGLL